MPAPSAVHQAVPSVLVAEMPPSCFFSAFGSFPWSNSSFFHRKIMSWQTLHSHYLSHPFGTVGINNIGILLLQGARTSAYMRTCSELEPPCSFWLQLSEYDWMPHIII